MIVLEVLKMSYKKTIGIIGQGFVGTAIKEGLKNHYNIETYDKYNAAVSTCHGIEELSSKTKIFFVCLPTPMKKDGSCDISIVKSTVLQIDKQATSTISGDDLYSHAGDSYRNIVVIKSTVPPGTTKHLNSLCDNIQVVFNPEFLTEANYIEDFKNQNRIIVGGPRPATTTIKNLYRKVFPKVPIVKTGSDTAEAVKYFINCFLATKVSFANEFSQICENMNIDFDKVVEYGTYDDRIGKTHLSVPGPDGRFGFGGSCFPKDTNALINFSNTIGVNPIVLSAVWNKNLEVRPERDWEQLKGRAVVYNKGEQNEQR